MPVDLRIQGCVPVDLRIKGWVPLDFRIKGCVPLDLGIKGSLDFKGYVAVGFIGARGQESVITLLTHTIPSD